MDIKILILLLVTVISAVLGETDCKGQLVHVKPPTFEGMQTVKYKEKSPNIATLADGRFNFFEYKKNTGVSTFA
jgi:hypothetical protein